MPYGDWLHRQELAMQMEIEASGRSQDIKGKVLAANQAVTAYEFGKCVVEHNLEDDDGNLLDFRGPRALDLLDPKIGNEIGTYIAELHEFDAGNSNSGSSTS
jgi:hypothetical protein